MRTKPRDNLIGKKFNHLTVVGQSENDYVKPNGKHETLWNCLCDCGNPNIIKAKGYCLKNGKTNSCGCAVKEKKIQIGKELHKKYLGLNKKYNTYKFENEIGIGITSNGKEFLFDKEDYDKIKKFCWIIGKSGYVNTHGPMKTNILLHRYIMNVQDNNIYIDHINHNTLDNRKQNLRMVTASENGMNKGIQSNNTSGFTGVYFHSSRNLWCAYIKINKKQIRKYCKTKEEAIVLRKELENKYFGDYSYINSLKIGEQNEKI